jgi:glycine/D-amino acid oxidase-like deaminating enzyme
MHAPAVGRAMADWILTGQPVDLDSAAFSLARFAGEPLHIDAALF